MEIELTPNTAFHPALAGGITLPRIIAHRGYSKIYPENTLLALHQALKNGACFVEFDVQVSADGTPVLFHDADLSRTTSQTGNVLDLSFAELRTIQACEFSRFGRRFANSGVGIPSLRDAVYLMKNWPQARAFVELKEESLKKFGIEKVAKSIVGILGPALDQCTVISYDSLAIRCARAMGARSIGWVIKEWNDQARSIATGLAPDYLFCNISKLPRAVDELWPGPWEWALYDVDDPELALYLAAIGANLVETRAVGELLQHPILRQGGCFDGCAL